MRQSISPAKPDHFVGCGSWPWALWKMELAVSFHHSMTTKEITLLREWQKAARVTTAFIRCIAVSERCRNLTSPLEDTDRF